MISMLSVKFQINDLQMEILSYRLQELQSNEIVGKLIDRRTTPDFFVTAEAQTFNLSCPTRDTLDQIEVQTRICRVHV